MRVSYGAKRGVKKKGAGDDVSPIGYYILEYLADHPDAEDTLEGIMGWWLLEQKIKYETARVKETLGDLVNKGIVVECRTENLPVRYRMNKSKKSEIQNLLRELKGIEGTG